MKVFIMLLATLTSCFGVEFEKLEKQAVGQLEIFKNNPTKDNFDQIKNYAEQMIEIKKEDPSGYVCLSRLYKYSSGTFLSKKSADRKISFISHELGEEVLKQLDLFKISPSKGGFEKIKYISEEIIEMSESNSIGYLYLSTLYRYASGILFDESTAIKSALDVIGRYQQLKNRNDNLEELERVLLQMYNEVVRRNKINSDSEKMLKHMKQPEAVVDAQKILEEYDEIARHNRGCDQSRLDEAVIILNKALKKDGTNYKLYMQLYRTYRAREDYAHAYIMWRLAYHFGDHEDLSLVNITTDLYMNAMNYARNTKISDDNSGENHMLYFLWLNRESFIEALPLDVKFRIEKDFLEKDKKYQSKGLVP